MTVFLASVQNIDEAIMALECDVDMIDLKNPHQGALGALPCNQVKEIVSYVNKRKTVSATIGDLPMQPVLLGEAASNMANTGVDIVKVGFFEYQNITDCLTALGKLRHTTRLVAVLFADLGFQLDVIQPIAEAGFYGVMLDTAIKNGNGLRDACSPGELRQFVGQAHDFGLFTGLAGALKYEDIPALNAHQPDYLGFRSALCTNVTRTMALDQDKLLLVREMLYSCHDTVGEMAVSA